MSSGLNVIEQALYARLAGTSSLVALLATATSIYNEVAPQGAAYPLVIFDLQAGGDDNKSPRRARWARYLVKGVSQKSMQDAGSIDNWIDNALHLQPPAVADWTITWLMRESSDVRYVEMAADGKKYFHAGGIYRVRWAQN